MHLIEKKRLANLIERQGRKVKRLRHWKC